MIVELTPEEVEEFTPINRAAIDWLLKRRQDEPDSPIPPCWLCMSPEARQEVQKDLLSYLNEQIRPIVPLTEETAGSVVDHLPDIQHQIDLWKQAELSLKKQRQEGNPRAYFME